MSGTQYDDWQIQAFMQAHEWCHIHSRPEPDVPGDYRACGECWHVFRTAEELKAETAKHGVVVPDDANEIWVCPLCTHGF